MGKFGITENGDPSMNPDWVQNIYDKDGSILITKKLTPWFKTTVMALSYLPIILHVSCTGYGGTVLEPHLDSYQDTIANIRELIDLSFPAERIVLRVDPIIPTEKGIKLFVSVIEYAKEICPEIKRVRLSVMDMYPHVRERFKKAGLPCPYGNNFQASPEMFKTVNEQIEKLKEKYPEVSFETCAETKLPAAKAVGCVSKQDYEILGVALPDESKKGQRKTCLCLGDKTDLLPFEWNKTGYNHCYGCLYCYWQTEKDKE
jgi:hypothetical protein